MTKPEPHEIARTILDHFETTTCGYCPPWWENNRNLLSGVRANVLGTLIIKAIEDERADD